MVKRFRPGDRVTVIMGIDAGKQATVIERHYLPTDGRGIPRVGRGHFKPLEPDDVVIGFEDGTVHAVRPRWIRRG